jgi:redox-sensitive bicupin YhaK (pirin superfamily)
LPQTRSIQKTFKSQPTLEGAGVHLRRAFGFREPPLFDPFLLLDDFRNDIPENYLKGFPWHPHRGIETITYMLAGEVEHGDSMGNQGVISAGDVQWMTAGNGIIHQEMPRGNEQGAMYGFQLWANLPASHKMMAPRYQEVKSSQIPEVDLESGARVRVVCGQVNGVQGPVRDIITDPAYLDVRIPPGCDCTLPTAPGHTVLAYIFEGEAHFADLEAPQSQEILGNQSLALFGDGEMVHITTQEAPVRFLLISGKPIGEPVAWYGPIVMNTQAELKTAFEELRLGTFIKHPQ